MDKNLFLAIALSILVYAAWFYQTYKWKAGILVGYIGCKSDRTGESIAETINIMRALQKEVPQESFELKRLDNLNSFVFNVDTPHDLVEAYGRYYMRKEPLDTLDKIQDAFIGASRTETGESRNPSDPPIPPTASAPSAKCPRGGSSQSQPACPAGLLPRTPCHRPSRSASASA